MGLKAIFVVMAVAEMYIVAIHPLMSPTWLFYVGIVIGNIALYWALPRAAAFLLRFGVHRP